ncbi:MAG TPA: ABC transporter permease subunit [Pirellulaceae bacterium]|jgi:ABC-type transport system involved in multi-copper enzyme maturation permease subunit
MFSASPILLADLFDRFRLQLPDPIVNWLTPVWILCIGATIGLILTAALWGIFWLLSRIPGVGTLADDSTRRWTAIGILTIALFGVFAVLYTNASNHPANPPAAAAGAQAAPAQSLDNAWVYAGCLAAALLTAAAIVILSSRKALAETDIALREGVLWPLLITALVMAGCAVFGLFIVRKPMDLLDSLARWPVIAIEGNPTWSPKLEAVPPGSFEEPAEQIIDVQFRRDEIRRLSVTSDQHVRLRSDQFNSTADPATTLALDIPAGETKIWRREEASANPFRQTVVTKLYAKNLGNAPATVRLTVMRRIANPEMLLAPVMAVSMAIIFFAYLLQRAAFPKLAAVALSTAKSDIAQPLYAILMAGGIFGLIVFVFIPYNTFGDDIKQLKDSGLSLILVLCVLQSVWAASSSVADEVEGKTALTVLSKPVSRRDFILGKFFGIGWSTGLMAIIFGLLLLVTVAYKPIYDYREGGYEINHQAMNNDPTWHDCHREMVQTVPGIVLAYLETLVIAALSVAISTRLPSIANFLISFAIYVLGHLTPLLVQSQVVAQQLPPVVFFGRLIATVLPVLDHFNIQASVAAGVPVPMQYLVWSLVYCGLYSAIAMLLALTLFEDRDLA